MCEFSNVSRVTLPTHSLTKPFSHSLTDQQLHWLIDSRNKGSILALKRRHMNTATKTKTANGSSIAGTGHVSERKLH